MKSGILMVVCVISVVFCGMVAYPVMADDNPADGTLTPPVSLLTPPDPDGSPFLTEEHFVMHWLLLGPFEYDPEDFAGDEHQAAATHAFVEDEAALDGTQPAPEGTSWRRHHFVGNLQAGQVDLIQAYGPMDYVAAYAVAVLRCEQAMENLQLWVGSDDYMQIWINGELVHTYDQRRRGADWDQDLVEDVSLRAGDNHIVVKCVDVIAGWDFYFRFTDEDDLPLAVRALTNEADE
jgi:hypothetical protein